MHPAHDLLLEQLTGADRVHLAAHPLRHRRWAHQRLALAQALHVLRGEVVVVAVGDQDQVGGRGPSGHPVGVYVDEGTSDPDTESRVAEPVEGVEGARVQRLAGQPPASRTAVPPFPDVTVTESMSTFMSVNPRPR